MFGGVQRHLNSRQTHAHLFLLITCKWSTWRSRSQRGGRFRSNAFQCGRDCVPLSDPYRWCHTEFIPRLLGVTLNSFPCLWSPSLSPNERVYGNINWPMGCRFLECHLSECGTIQMGLLLGGPEWNQISVKWSLPAEVHRILPLRFSSSKRWWEVYFAFGKNFSWFIS